MRIDIGGEFNKIVIYTSEIKVCSKNMTLYFKILNFTTAGTTAL